MPRALITGISGQDGSYLAELLLDKGYEVYGIMRPDAEHEMARIAHILPRLQLHQAMLEDFGRLREVIQMVNPDECYHLAAQSFVGGSFDDEFGTMHTNIDGTHHMLAAVKEATPACRFYFASSSEMMGKPREMPQTEQTPFHPRSTYGISKVAGFHLTRHYREVHGMHASCGILYNHESPRRGEQFVTRKITRHVALIKHGQADELRLGNLDAKRDWGHARDYVRAAWLMLQQEHPDDYIIASGVAHSVREFCQRAFEHVGLDWEKYVVVDPKFFRPTEVDIPLGDASKAKRVLRWESKSTFEDLVKEMVDADMALIEQG